MPASLRMTPSAGKWPSKISRLGRAHESWVPIASFSSEIVKQEGTSTVVTFFWLRTLQTRSLIIRVCHKK
jgi:hypothetical protein